MNRKGTIGSQCREMHTPKNHTKLTCFGNGVVPEAGFRIRNAWRRNPKGSLPANPACPRKKRSLENRRETKETAGLTCGFLFNAPARRRERRGNGGRDSRLPGCPVRAQAQAGTGGARRRRARGSRDRARHGGGAARRGASGTDYSARPQSLPERMAMAILNGAAASPMV